MITVPNQKTVKVHKASDDDRAAALQEAMNKLKGEVFKLWMYLAKNNDNYYFALSPKDAEAWGITRSSYHRGVEALINAGYLVQHSEGSNVYDFYEMLRQS